MKSLVILVLLFSCSSSSAIMRSGFVDVVKDCGVNPGRDVTAVLSACIESLLPESILYFEPGVYTVSRALPPIVGSHISLTAKAQGVARIKFTGCGNLLTFINNRKINFNSEINNLWLNATRTDCVSTAITIVDASRFTVDSTIIKGYTKGIVTFGREFLTIRDVKIEADKPIVISKNPNHATLDSDHTLINRLYSIVNSSKYYHITVDSGVTLTNFTLTDAAMPKGSGILYWKSLVDPGRISYHVTLSNIRHEQNQGIRSIYIYLTKPLYGLTIDNVRLEGPYRPNSVAMYFNNVLGISVVNSSYPNNSCSTFIEATNVDSINIENSFYYPISKLVTGLSWMNGPFKSRNSERVTGLLSNAIMDIP